MKHYSKLLKTLASELDYALSVFQDTCQCKNCGSCQRQTRIKALITQSRDAAKKLEMPISQCDTDCPACEYDLH